MNNKSCSLMLLSVLFISSSLFMCSCNFFPQRDEIDKYIDSYRQEESREQRVLIIKEMLKDISDPANKDDDEVVVYATSKLTDLFRSNNDLSILVAVDETRIYAGFANYICVFYYSIRNEPGFQKRYIKREYFPYVERCKGLSFSYDEMKDIANNTAK